ncbi:MAG: HAD family hydrolase [Deltaproteobacteria bacterium]|nr:HAD family hydrolase [Deltaproteobacteria bacterium]
MKFEAVIFDLDGTLLDTLRDIADAGNAVLAGNGFPTHDVDAYRGFIGSGVPTLMNRALPKEKRNLETATRLADEFREEYNRNWNVSTKPYPGVAEMLDQLQSLSIKRAVLSNKPHDFAKLCVNGLLSSWTFDAVMGYNDQTPPKPDPKGALRIAARLKLSPSRILYVGDSDIDMRTAITAEMYPIGVLWGFRSKEELLENGARALLEKPQDLLAFFR